ncbi:MAG: cytochrome c oxidase assembly protein [Chloroflexota bacterium]|nr:cytochrome c oxidase assembly protein [Chloroflexota bacterium]
MSIWTNIPILHVGGPEPDGWLHSNWRPEPTVVAGALGLIALYVIWTGSRNRNEDGSQINPVSTGQKVMFILGAAIGAISLLPPLDDWSAHYLLSAHMYQHLLLMMVSVPLMIAGTPAWLVMKLVAHGKLRPVLYVLTRPPISFVLGNLIIVIWHMPFAYNQALMHEWVHVIQHISFIVASFFTWWPVLSRSPELPGLPPLLSCLYLFLNSIPGAVVGAVITFAEPGLYAVYPDAQRIFGIDLQMDQELAGVTMWVLTGTVYLGWITVIFLRWAAAEERRDRATTPRPAAPATPA